jgi:tetratricopeptide (TPR) repeat protein
MPLRRASGRSSDGIQSHGVADGPHHLHERGVVFRGIGWIALAEGDLVKARQFLEEALGLVRRFGHNYHLSLMLGDFAILLQLEGDLDGAESYVEEAISLAREVSAERTLAYLLGQRGDLARHRGHYDFAREDLRDALTALHPQAAMGWTIEQLERFAALFLSEGNAEAAGRLLVAVETLLEAPTSTMNAPLPQYHKAAVPRLEAALGKDGRERVRAEGTAMCFDDALACALSIAGRSKRSNRFRLRARRVDRYEPRLIAFDVEIDTSSTGTRGQTCARSGS